MQMGDMRGGDANAYPFARSRATPSRITRRMAPVQRSANASNNPRSGRGVW